MTEQEALRAFFNELMHQMWNGDIDNFDVQELAEEHGLIHPVTNSEDDDEFFEGDFHYEITKKFKETH